MKRMLLPLLLVMPLASFAGHGQDHDAMHEPPMGRHMHKVMKKLELTDKQQAEMKEIFEAHREQMRTLREQTEKKVDAILTPEQRTTMQEMRQKRAEKWREHMEEQREERREAGAGKEHDHEHGEEDITEDSKKSGKEKDKSGKQK